MTDHNLFAIANAVNAQRVEIELQRATALIIDHVRRRFADDRNVGEPTWRMNGQGRDATDLSVTITIPLGGDDLARVIEALDPITMPSYLEQTCRDLESEIMHHHLVSSRRQLGGT